MWENDRVILFVNYFIIERFLPGFGHRLCFLDYVREVLFWIVGKNTEKDLIDIEQCQIVRSPYQVVQLTYFDCC